MKLTIEASHTADYLMIPAGHLVEIHGDRFEVVTCDEKGLEVRAATGPSKACVLFPWDEIQSLTVL